MAIEYNGKIYRNLQEQVLKNQEDIETLMESGGITPGGDITDIESRLNSAENNINKLNSRVTTAEEDIDALDSRVTNLDNKVTNVSSQLVDTALNVGRFGAIANNSLQLPDTAPIATQLVAVNSANAQDMITLGSGLTIEDGILNTTGGGGGSTGSGKYLHVIKFRAYDEMYLATAQYGQIILLLNTSTNFTGTSTDTSPTYEQFEALGQAMANVGYHSVSVLVHEDDYSGTFTSLSFRPDSGSGGLVVDTSDGESLGNNSFYDFYDTVIPL